MKFLLQLHNLASDEVTNPHIFQISQEFASKLSQESTVSTYTLLKNQLYVKNAFQYFFLFIRWCNFKTSIF